jgi:hypothetical protein
MLDFIDQSFSFERTIRQFFFFFETYDSSVVERAVACMLLALGSGDKVNGPKSKCGHGPGP